jgi:hypothetical protein
VKWHERVVQEWSAGVECRSGLQEWSAGVECRSGVGTVDTVRDMRMGERHDEMEEMNISNWTSQVKQPDAWLSN